MPEGIPFPLRVLFPPVSTSEWDALIRADLPGADYERKLLWRADDGVTVKPYYRVEDLAKVGAAVFAAPGAFPFLRGSGVPWVIEDTFVPASDAIRADTWHDEGATSVQEIAWAVAAGVELFNGSAYRHDAVLMVAGGAALSPHARGLDLYHLPRIQATEAELGYWIGHFDKRGEERYMSDGDPATVTVPRGQIGQVRVPGGARVVERP